MKNLNPNVKHSMLLIYYFSHVLYYLIHQSSLDDFRQLADMATLNSLIPTAS